MDQQGDWRFCGKCEVMFFDGFPTKGACAAGGPHSAAGFNFTLPHDGAPTPNDQGDWRFCQKCNAMFFNGFPSKGICVAGGAHDAAGYTFVLPHDVPASAVAQDSWRFCQKCSAMFFNGFPSKGICAAGGGHDAAGYNFVLPHVDPDTATFDSGPLTSGLPLGGSAHLVMRRNGDFTLTTHAHDSGFDNIDYALSVVLITAMGFAFTYQHTGHVEGTSAGLPFGTPNRNDDVTASGQDAAITREWDGIQSGARLFASLDGKDKLLGGLQGMLNDLLSEAAQAIGKAGATAVESLAA
jgi:hypothetical protein